MQLGAALHREPRAPSYIRTPEIAHWAGETSLWHLQAFLWALHIMIHHSSIVDSLTRRELAPGVPCSSGPSHVSRYEVCEAALTIQSRSQALFAPLPAYARRTPHASSKSSTRQSRVETSRTRHQPGLLPAPLHRIDTLLCGLRRQCFNIPRPDSESGPRWTLPVPPVCRSEPHRRAVSLQDACTTHIQRSVAALVGAPPPSL
ncbi:hypothetical protein CDEST_09683 [Colletotrichum destructivum]|uniref:Uncharacterized protein n=1 Tax=Colletotrichum destructivum TaxID=34406 RepID=A0AAX4IP84_9PEZI|nr:hypothetical protein CDEST_09683 [Colletotrichum destructivum]